MEQIAKVNWYAVYTKPRWEKKVAYSLSQNDIENYCPLNKILKHWSDRKKIVEEPLFKSYVFVRVNLKQQNKLQQIDGVVNFVHWLGKPAVIRENDIELIRRFLNEYSNIQIEPITLKVDDKVKIINGPFMEMEADVIEVNKKTVKVLLPSLHYMMSADIENVRMV